MSTMGCIGRGATSVAAQGPVTIALGRYSLDNGSCLVLTVSSQHASPVVAQRSLYPPSGVECIVVKLWLVLPAAKDFARAQGDWPGRIASRDCVPRAHVSHIHQHPISQRGTLESLALRMPDFRKEAGRCRCDIISTLASDPWQATPLSVHWLLRTSLCSVWSSVSPPCFSLLSIRVRCTRLAGANTHAIETKCRV